jgi:hypothetical protein
MRKRSKRWRRKIKDGEACLYISIRIVSGGRDEEHSVVVVLIMARVLAHSLKKRKRIQQIYLVRWHWAYREVCFGYPLCRQRCPWDTTMPYRRLCI